MLKLNIVAGMARSVLYQAIPSQFAAVRVPSISMTQRCLLSPEMEKKKILVVDDEPEMQIFLTNLLHTSGFDAVIAESGTAELSEIIAEIPDLIILNMMRYRDRQSLLYRILKTDEKLKAIPVLMLSSLDRKTFFHFQRLKKFPVGGALPEPEAFILKPPEADELLQVVQTLTGSLKSQTVEEEV
jgi:two-component system, OmpR family, phosphate regulon response regulator PhoB